MSEYPDQPRTQGGWPTQPPQYTGYEQDRHQPDGYGLGYEPPPPRRRRRRRRGWIALLCTLIVLAVLFVIADQVAKAYAQNMIASRIQTSGNLTEKPSVSIEGFPFLTQLAARDIRTVHISASNVQENKIEITSIKATATGVHLDSGFNSATIDHITGTAFISFASLESAAGVQGATISADPAAGPNAVSVAVGPLSATAQIVQTGPNEITVKMGGLGGIAAALIGALPGYTIHVPTLPAGLQVQGVTVVSQGIAINAAAQNTTLSQ